MVLEVKTESVKKNHCKWVINDIFQSLVLVINEFKGMYQYCENEPTSEWEWHGTRK